jgi:ribosome maturation factor RimP
MLEARSIGGNREAWGSPHASFYESWKEERIGMDIELPVVARIRGLVVPIATDLGLDVYDIEQRGGTLRITLDTPPGAGAGVTLDLLALASRLISKEFDQHDPIPSRYILEVTSPGVERSLRTPAHFQREVGKVVAIRLANVEAAQRRVQGVISAADDDGVTIHTGDGDQRIAYTEIDRAKSVFEWGGQPKPGARRKVAVEQLSNPSAEEPAGDAS